MATNKYIKGFLEDIVLHLIHEKGEMYGYEITKKVQEISNGTISVTEGALYPVLHKLENNGLLSSDFKKENGRMRKYYSLTQNGEKDSMASIRDVHDFLAGLNSVFNLNSAAK